MAIYKTNKPTNDGRKYFFRIKYRDIFGISHDYSSQKFFTKKEAEQEEAKYRIKIANNNTNTNNPTLDIIFNEFYESKKKTIKVQTLRGLRQEYDHLKVFACMKINDITLTHYRKFLNYLDNINLTCTYKNKILGLFRRLLLYSNKYYNTSLGILRYIENYKDPSSVKKEMQFFTYEEYKKFDSVIDSFEWHTFFELLYFMGLRQGECQALTWNDIDFNKKTIRVNKTLTSKIKGTKYVITSPKTQNSIRILPMPKSVLNDLKTMFSNANIFKDFSNEWFVFGNSIPFKETNITNKKNAYCLKAKVKQIRIHDFRHSCASLLINNNATPVLVSKYLGHSKVSLTLNTYSHLFKSELENIVDLINNLE